MRRLFLSACLLFAMSVAALAADVTGTWHGTLMAPGPDGASRSDTIVAVLKQTDGKITGTLGPNSDQQMPLTEATLKENKLDLKLVQGNRTMHLELTIDNDKMTGTASRSRDGVADPQKGKVELARAK